MTNEKKVKVEASRSGGEPVGESVTPLVDIYEKDNAVILQAELPGAGEQDVSVHVDKGVLTVEDRPKPPVPGEQYRCTHSDFQPTAYFRAFALSDEIDREKITASMASGLLTVHLPKAEQARSRKIPVRTTG